MSSTLRTSTSAAGIPLVHGFWPERFGARELTIEADSRYVVHLRSHYAPRPALAVPPADVPVVAPVEGSAIVDVVEDPVASAETSAPESATTSADVAADAGSSPSVAHVTTPRGRRGGR